MRQSFQVSVRSLIGRTPFDKNRSVRKIHLYLHLYRYRYHENISKISISSSLSLSLLTVKSEGYCIHRNRIFV